MKNIYLQFLDLLSDKSNLVLATVTSTFGSTPQKPGSSAIFDDSGLIAGTVGGGVVERKVVKLAGEAILSKKSSHCHFNLGNDISKSDEAICGGQISVLIDGNIMNHKYVFEQLKKSMEDRIPGVLITMVTAFTEDNVLINRYWMTGTVIPPIPDTFLEKIEPVVITMLEGGNQSDYRELELKIPDEEPSSLFFLEAVFPPSKLVIAGAGHVGRALAHLADMLDFVVTVIDDRPEFACIENIPEASNLIVSDIGQAIEDLKKTKDTYIVIVTHGHKDDAAALKSCIRSEVAYIGMIGSKVKIAAIRENFIRNGWATIGQWEAVHTPIGLEIKSRTVAEIALSIAAQLVLVRNSTK
jgi:xanthine dehydrogenase accessory factor